MASKIEEFLRKFRGGQFQEQNVLRGEVLPRNIISGRITERPLLPAPGPVRTGKLPGRDIATTPIGELTAGELDEFSRVFDAKEVPVPTDISGARKIDVPTDITGATELLAGGRVPEVLPDTGAAPGFDWPKFIETAGRLGAALAPRGVFAKAGIEAAAMVGEEREREVARAKGAEDLRRFEINTKLKEVDDALNQARLDWQKDPSNPRSMENLLKLEQERNRLRIELDKAKQPAKAAKAKTAADKAKGIIDQQVKNRIRSAKNSVMTAIRRHDTAEVPQLIGFTKKQITRVMEIIRGMDITGNETTDEIIQMAVDLLGIETGISGHEEISASELMGPIEEGTDFITNEELLRGVR